MTTLILLMALAQNPVKSATVRVDGTSTLHPWSAKSQTAKIELSLDPAALSDDEALRNGALKQLKVTVPVRSLSSGEGGLDDNLRKTLDAEKHPEITWVMQTYEVSEPNSTGQRAVVAHGVLTLAAASRPVDVTGVVGPEAGGWVVKGKKQLKMTDFGVTPPKFMLGTLKTGDQVTVSFELHLAK